MRDQLLDDMRVGGGIAAAIGLAIVGGLGLALLLLA
jgi:hypothetical protein